MSEKADIFSYELMCVVIWLVDATKQKIILKIFQHEWGYVNVHFHARLKLFTLAPIYTHFVLVSYFGKSCPAWIRVGPYIR